jgi:ribosomal-protein-alanine N-acetyltransferase
MDESIMMIIPMTIIYAAQVSGWTYENEYSIYSFPKNDDTVQELMNGDYYACLDQCNELLGYFCFGKSAQIPTMETDAYNSEMLDIGLGMQPALCGKGRGYLFVKAGLDFAIKEFHNRRLRLTVASFNQRAIYVYEKIGFRHSAIVTHNNTKKAFRIMTYEYLIN